MSDEDKVEVILKLYEKEAVCFVIHGRSDKMLLTSDLILVYIYLYILTLICLFGVLRRFQHCTGHITTGSWKGRGNQYI